MMDIEKECFVCWNEINNNELYCKDCNIKIHIDCFKKLTCTNKCPHCQNNYNMIVNYSLFYKIFLLFYNFLTHI